MKVLIVKMSSFGDIVHTFPAISDLHRFNNDIEFDWVVEDYFQEVLQLNPFVNRMILVAFRKWKKNVFSSSNRKEFFKFLSNLRQEKYDYILDPQGLLKSAIVSMFAKGPRIGYDWSSIREPMASVFYNKKYNVSKDQHAITRIRKLFAKAMGYKYIDDTPHYGLKVLDVELPIELFSKYITFFPGTSKDNKCWPVAKWVMLAKELKNKGYDVLVHWGNEQQKEVGQQIAKEGEGIQLLPKCNILQMAKIINSSKGVVGLDSGYAHLTAAYDIPAVSLYGPTNIKLIGSWGKNHKHMDLYHDSPSLVANSLIDLI